LIAASTEYVPTTSALELLIPAAIGRSLMNATSAPRSRACAAKFAARRWATVVG